MASRALDPDFAEDLGNFDLEALDADASSIVGLWRDLRIGYYNQGWARFAEANGGHDILARWPLGASIAGVVAEELRPFFADLFAAARPGGTPVEHLYECSTPSTFRAFVMRVHGLRRGHLVVHSLRQTRPHDRVPAPAVEGLYRGVSGFIVQCSHCRRTRRAEPPPQWDWVPEWVAASPARTSHGLCPVCRGYYYPRRPSAR